MPISMISLVDEKRQWFKSVSGWDKKETPREEAFCAHAILEEELFIVPDAVQDERFHDNPLVVQNPKIRFYAGAPLIDPKGKTIGTLCVMDREKRELTDEQKDAMKRLSRQVMAQMELRLRNIELNRLMHELKHTQRQLIVQEKMVSLGHLVTGIAHEIKNPLNFINNFSSLSSELLSEFHELFDSWKFNIDKNDFITAGETLFNIRNNISRIEEHGKRADNIVKSLSRLSPKSRGEFVETDINNFLKDNVNALLYDFRNNAGNLDVDTCFTLDQNLRKANIISGDFGLAIKNIIDNSFYAIKRKYNSANGYKPELKITTTRIDGFYKISIFDNGTGIRQEIIKNVFTPFFTTKPPGEGSGLGLSSAYDIIVQYHGGRIEIDSKEGEYTEVSIYLHSDYSSAVFENNELESVSVKIPA